MTVPLEKRDAEVLFELLDGVSDRGRHAEQLLRCSGETSAPADGVEYLQTFK